MEGFILLTRIVTTALLSGFTAGILAAVLQFFLVQPLLLHAELFESGNLTHFGSTTLGTAAHTTWSVVDPMREALSVVFTAITYTGYSFMLVAGLALAVSRGHHVTLRNGIIWGMAGFVTVQLAPAMGLPPELPGAGTADVTTRQVWWFATVAATGWGLWLIAFSQSSFSWVFGVAALAIPHIIGAPEPDILTGPVPPEIAAHFASRSLGTGLAAWAILGASCSYFWNKGA